MRIEVSSMPDSSPRRQLPLQLAAPKSSCYQEISDLIAGANAAPWLPNFLFNSAIGLGLDRHVHNQQPGRADMRKQLEAISGAVALIQRGLGDVRIRNFLEDDPLGAMPYHGALDHILRDLALRADTASKSSRLVDDAGKTRAGRSRATTSCSFSPQVYCALLILEVWRHFNGRYPAVRNRKAAQAAELLWCATGEKRLGWGSDPLTAWENQLRAARALPTAEELRADLQRSMNLHAQDWERRNRPDDESRGG
jgi:hypothetical protein